MSIINRTGLAVTSKLGLWDIYARVSDLVYKSRVRIVMYHRVAESTEHPWSLTSVSPRNFEDQIKYARSKYNVISLEELASHITGQQPLPQRPLVLTFDDGYRDNYLHAYPILQKYNTPATIFLTTGYIGTGELLWVDKVRYNVYHSQNQEIRLAGLGSYSLSTIRERQALANLITGKAKKLNSEERSTLIAEVIRSTGIDVPASLGKELMMSWDEVKEMSDNGISFGAHTVSHPILTSISPEQAENEILQSKKDIEDRLKKPVTTFAYPNGKSGDYDRRTIQILKEAGFTCAVTTIKGMATSKQGLYELRRISPGWDLPSFKFLTCGLFYHLLVRRGS